MTTGTCRFFLFHENNSVFTTANFFKLPRAFAPFYTHFPENFRENKFFSQISCHPNNFTKWSLCFTSLFSKKLKEKSLFLIFAKMTMYGKICNCPSDAGNPACAEAWRQVLLHGAHPGQGGRPPQAHPAGFYQGRILSWIFVRKVVYNRLVRRFDRLRIRMTCYFL